MAATSRFNLQQVFHAILQPSTETDLLEAQRARVLRTIALVVGVIALFSTVIFVVLSAPSVNILYADAGMVGHGIANAIMFAMLFVVQVLLRRGRVRLASLLYVLVFQVALVAQFVYLGMQPEVFILFALPIIMSAVLLGRTWTTIITIAAVGALWMTMIPGYPDQIPAQGGIFTTAPVAAASLLLGTVGYIVLAFIASSLIGMLELYVHTMRRTNLQLEAAAALSQAAATSRSLAELLELVVTRIQKAYGFYHAQVFLVDQEGRNARLQASTGRAGAALLARGHYLPVGSQSVVGQCTGMGQPVVVNDTARSATHRPNPLLPDTRAELALPLVVQNQVIGAIDVQSVVPDVFQPDDIRSLQVMAGQLAVSINQTRLLEELQTRAAENEGLLRDAQGNLREIEELNRRLTREGWADYLRARRSRGGLGYTLSSQVIERDTGWTTPMRQAYQSERSVVIRQDQHANIAAIPMRLRGETIGVLEVERSGERPWTNDELEMAEVLVERLVIAIENARLYEQATQSIQREQFVNQVSQQVQSAQTIDEVLQAALTELSAMLGASRGVVQISPRDTAPPDGGQVQP
ncbi:MAG: GAF domain-containing protein [Anaerolineae bacterium]|nr:GAF domain-containing protein [Anaerolineae bacterium]